MLGRARRTLCAPQQAATLREQGHDAVAVLEIGLSGQPDEKIRDYAIAEDRVLLTLDADFANILRFPPTGTPGVIRLKIHPPTEAGIGEQIRKALSLLEGRSLRDCLAVAHREVVRIRS
jgi:predicted nuclease of predicted toxin-antitoxin system